MLAELRTSERDIELERQVQASTAKLVDEKRCFGCWEHPDLLEVLSSSVFFFFWQALG